MRHAYVKAHDASEVRIHEVLKHAHKFPKISHSGINLFVYVGKEDIQKYMHHEVSITVYIGRIANQRKVPKWLPFKNCKSGSLNI